MANLVVVRLHPDKPVSGADFTNFLAGLTLTVFDLNSGDPKIGTKAGTASYVAPPNPPTPWIPDPTTGIVQHFTGAILPLLPTPEAAATAVIELNLLPAGYNEYVSPDLRVEIARGGTPISDKQLYYDVATLPGPMPAPGTFQSLPATDVGLYLALPRPLGAGLASLDLSDHGSPPSFADLKAAVLAVLGADELGAPPAALGNLTAAQARHVAYEIVWGLQDPLPVPPSDNTPPLSDDLGALYSDPPNDGTVGNKLEQGRQRFEGDLSAYYSTHDAEADRLTRFVFALSAAVACEGLSTNAKTALVEFPVNPGGATALAPVKTAQVLLVDGGGGSLVPAFTVPAEYFYVLGAHLPEAIDPPRRFLMACRDQQEHLLPMLTAAVDDGIISATLPINPAQATRRLAVLAPVPDAIAPHCAVDPTVQPLVTDWLAFPSAAAWRTYAPGDDAVDFWTPELAARPAAYLELVLCALTDAFQPLMNAIVAFPVASVAALASLTDVEWRAIFGDPINVALLPPFTAPGSPDARVDAFIHHVQKFFDMAGGAGAVPPATADAPPRLDLPTDDVIAAFVAEYQLLLGLPFTFGSGPLDPAKVASAAQVIFPAELAAQAWLVQRVQVVNDLCLLAGVVSGPMLPTASPEFSIAEALYARGFTSVADVAALSLDDFTDALRGTVAYAQVGTIWAKAGGVGPPPKPAPGPFRPVNPGSLVDCIPPCWRSPLGPVEYLHELLTVSEASTCADPFAAPPPGKKTLGQVVAARRGPLGDLAVTAANAETQLPLLDIVNENLEHFAATLPAAPVGIVHDTAGDALAGHPLCPPGEKGSASCHEAAKLLEALPEHSSPAVPVNEPAAYDKLKTDFSAPALPYSQPLDLCRTYLDHLRSCRFEAMRTSREEITEFALDPTLSSPTFQSHLWRYPVRIEIAIEYLQITPEEYDLLFTKDVVDVPTLGHLVLHELYGFDVADPGGADWSDVARLLPQFLARTGLTYCELVELQKSGCFEFVLVHRRTREDAGRERLIKDLPDCPPCCLEDYVIHFVQPADQREALRKLAVFLRLWQKLQDVCGARYTFAQLCDICEVLQLFIGPAINPDFVRQLVAFQILKDRFEVPLTDGTSAPGAHGADRTHLLALWVGPSAAKWDWAIAQLLDRIEHFARRRHEARKRSPHFLKLLATNLKPLSILAGFDPATPIDTWYAKPTHTLRYVEVLAKIYASRFGVGELLFLFTADDHLDGDDPFPLQDANESADDPLGLPEDDDTGSLWTLRRKLLEAEVSDEEVREWSWPRIEAALRRELGYDVPASGPDYLTSLGRHFFPGILGHSGTPVSPTDRQYRVALVTPSPDMWNIPPEGPFRYDAAAKQLWTQLPLRDETVVEKLEHLRDLTPIERAAVQDLYHLPRLDLAPFACFFPSFELAERHLVEEPDEEKRWEWFRHCFVLGYKRCRIIAEHLVQHVTEVTESEPEHGIDTAWLILKRLFADENRAQTPWEVDSGAVPDLTWKPLPAGGAFAALLGLAGTGLLGELRHADDTLAWREVRGSMDAFSHERNRRNAPVPTVLPAMDLTLPPEQLRYVGFRNGFAIQDQHGRELGGAESFAVTWSGALLVEEEGRYEFTAGAPTPQGEAPDLERAELGRWRVTLTRGQKTWVVLAHRWPHESAPGHAPTESSLELKRGAYGIVVDFVQPPPNFTMVDDIHPQHTGFEVKYSGPDTGSRLETLPLRRLYRDLKDDALDVGIRLPGSSVAGQFLKLHYTSTLRDMRRTYQRAFKALLFAHRFGLSGRTVPPYMQSELGYMLDHGDLFAGVSYFRNPALFARHAAQLDYNFLPSKDGFHPPPVAQDQRVQPSAKRKQALFDWFERLFDYAAMRRARARAIERPVWLLFEEALEQQPDNPAQLLRHLDVDLRHADLLLRYFTAQGSPVKVLTSGDLEDDRWAVRVWHGDRWLQRLLRAFRPKDVRAARPDLWASDDPGGLVAGETVTGNANLSRYVCDGCFESGEPRRYGDVKALDDRLRQRARAAFLAYLCGMNRVPLPWGGTAASPKDLSALLLLDVETGPCERASRIEEAVTAVQLFVQRARLGLEPGWSVGSAFAQLWEREFETYRVWERCKCRTLYKENWVEWDELRKARKIEAFRFLEEELRRNVLTVSVPGGLEYWPEALPPSHPAIAFLQKRVPSALRLLTPAREGLGVLGTPEHDARPSWLAAGDGGGDRPGQPETRPTRLLAGATAANLSGAGGAPADVAPQAGGSGLPLWIEAAIRLGVKFVRVAAAGVPPAATRFEKSAFREEPGCCHECECDHPLLVDEYYFWLVSAGVFDPVEQDEYYDPTQQVSLRWHEPDSLPKLLDWRTAPAARLAWCRVHNGVFGQPRRSVDAVELDAVELTTGSVPDLAYVGRVGDSLIFSVSVARKPPAGYSGADAPGFRYDIPVDAAIALPLVADPLPIKSPYPAGLPVYPYFAFVEPGDRLFPRSLFSAALSVASVLRCHCRFEPALKWYQLVLDPLASDNLWVHCEVDTPQPQPKSQPEPEPEPRSQPEELAGVPRVEIRSAQPAPERVRAVRVDATRRPPFELPPATCCDSTRVSPEAIHDRAVLLHYLETLVEWSQALLCRDSRESAQQARLVLDTAARILGPCPRVVNDHDAPPAQTVKDFVPLSAPLNPRLMELYCRVRDGLELVHRCLDGFRLRDGVKACRPPYWGQDPCACETPDRGCGCELEEPACDDDAWCRPASPYRFVHLLQKAQEAAARVRELGAALLSAFDRGDAEYLASMRARQEVELADMTIRVRQDQWRDSDWQVKALGKGKEVQQSNRRYYKRLIDLGLNFGELGYEGNTDSAIALRTAAIPIEVVGEVMRLIPDLFVGTSEQVWVPLGTKLSEMFSTIARITNESAEIAGINASLDLTQGGWQRRLDEWIHQVEVLDIEIEQTEIQILGAERRRGEALGELELQQRQLEQSREVFDTLRDKFTNHELYLFLQKETAAFHARMYELARTLAREAQRAFNFELGFTGRNFLRCEDWNELHEGLLAGERLQLALQRMEVEYFSCNRREYELVKHISLARSFPFQFLRLKITGSCEIEIPEWMFDVDHAGHYMRRIKSVSLTIPCVTGPYTGVHCRLTLLGSRTRRDPCLPCPVTDCCSERPVRPCGCRHERREHYEALPRDPRMVAHHGAREAIATSTGNNDSGLFELNFHDERHLPFEFSGAVSCWRVEMAAENNYFDMDGLTDVVMHMSYTAREGGEALRDAARSSARGKLPGNGWVLLDLAADFSDAWSRFRQTPADRERERGLTLDVTRRLFPFLPGEPALKIDKLALLYKVEEPHPRPCPEIRGCPCAHEDVPGSHLVEVTVDRPDEDRKEDEEEVEMFCVSSEEWPKLYHGVAEVEVPPIDQRRDRHSLTLTFRTRPSTLERAFLLLHYEAVEECCPTIRKEHGRVVGC